jgi:hypothetical protein
MRVSLVMLYWKQWGGGIPPFSSTNSHRSLLVCVPAEYTGNSGGYQVYKEAFTGNAGA